jgi:dihydrofolate reductase
MTRIIYRTATSFTGHIADENAALAWLFAVDHEGLEAHDVFLSTVGCLVEGSSTYEWVLREANLLAEPERWQQFYGSRPTFVFSSRRLPSPAGADVRFRQGAVGDHLAEIVAAAGTKDVWVVGGGDLAGQFLDAHALDEISLTLAPVALTGGAALFPRRLESDRLMLKAVSRQGQFAQIDYVVSAARSAIAEDAEAVG